MNQIFYGTIALFVVVMVWVTVAMVQDGNERIAKASEYQSTCKVIGDARDDSGDTGSTTRTVYQCPDGLIHIL